MKCPICNRRAFDISGFLDNSVEVTLKCPHCGKFVSIPCGKNTIKKSQDKVEIKERIANAATDIFFKNGYIESDIQEIANVVGLDLLSLQNHFKSKRDILDYILNFYKNAAGNFRASEESLARLTKDANTDDVIACMYLYFPKDEEAYYLKTLQMLFQERYRNNDVRDFIANNLILWQKEHVAGVLQRLVDAGALNKHIDIDFWAKLHVSITFIFAERFVIGIGEMFKQFEGKGMEAMLRTMYDLIFKLYGKTIDV